MSTPVIKTTLFVLIGHVMVLALLGRAPKKKAPRVPLRVVERVALSPKPQASPPVVQAPNKITPVKKTPPPKKPLKKAPPKKAPKKNIQKVPSPSPKQKELAKLLKQSLNSLDAPRKTPAAAPLKTAKLAPLSDELYKNELVAYLQALLTLPHPGVATVQLTLTREGSVAAFALIKCDNEENKATLLAEVKHLPFPPFGPLFKDEKTHTFLLTLNSR